MKPSPLLSEQLVDIQAVLRTGFGWLPHSRFWLLTVDDPVQAAGWLAGLQASGLLVSADAIGGRDGNPRPELNEAAAVAFSFEGLRVLGMNETHEFPFPTPFRVGMGSAIRAKLLRDESRGRWQWTDAVMEGTAAQLPLAHVMVMHWWNDDGAAATKFVKPPAGAFCQPARAVEGCASFFEGQRMTEPFGFRDGISQPVIDGLVDETSALRRTAERDAGTALYRDRQVLAGEFIVGYRNEYRELTYGPDVLGWANFCRGDVSAFAINGTYLAVRQIEQDVQAFLAWDRPVASYGACPAGVTYAEKMIGRRKDKFGTPLVWRGPRDRDVSDSQADAFRYRVEDSDGLVCPRGAHVRRVNPRDTLGVDSAKAVKNSKLHRLLRRGRPYRETVDGKPTAGVFFIAANADLERQFEFIYQRWLRNPRFANLSDEDDPLVGKALPGKAFTIQGLPIGESISIAEFTTTLGGGYFFLPGLRALGFIVDRGLAMTGAVTSASAAVV